MRRVRLLPRFLALFLSLAIGLPSPAHALRPASKAENAAGLEELKNRLLRDEPPSAGLEEEAAGVVAEMVGEIVRKFPVVQTVRIELERARVRLFIGVNPSEAPSSEKISRRIDLFADQWSKRLRRLGLDSIVLRETGTGEGQILFGRSSGTEVDRDLLEQQNWPDPPSELPSQSFIRRLTEAGINGDTTLFQALVDRDRDAALALFPIACLDNSRCWRDPAAVNRLALAIAAAYDIPGLVSRKTERFRKSDDYDPREWLLIESYAGTPDSLPDAEVFGNRLETVISASRLGGVGVVPEGLVASWWEDDSAAVRDMLVVGGFLLSSALGLTLEAQERAEYREDPGFGWTERISSYLPLLNRDVERTVRVQEEYSEVTGYVPWRPDLHRKMRDTAGLEEVDPDVQALYGRLSIGTGVPAQGALATQALSGFTDGQRVQFVRGLPWLPESVLAELLLFAASEGEEYEAFRQQLIRGALLDPTPEACMALNLSIAGRPDIAQLLTERLKGSLRLSTAPSVRARELAVHLDNAAQEGRIRALESSEGGPKGQEYSRIAGALEIMELNALAIGNHSLAQVFGALSRLASGLALVRSAGSNDSLSRINHEFVVMNPALTEQVRGTRRIRPVSAQLYLQQHIRLLEMYAKLQDLLPGRPADIDQTGMELSKRALAFQIELLEHQAEQRRRYGLPSAGLEEEVPDNFRTHERELVTEINAIGDFRVELDESAVVSRITSPDGNTVYYERLNRMADRLYLLASTPQGLLACEAPHGALYRYANREEAFIQPGIRTEAGVIREGVRALMETIAEAGGVASFELTERERKSDEEGERITQPGVVHMALLNGQWARVVISGPDGWLFSRQPAGLEEGTAAPVLEDVSAPLRFMVRQPDYRAMLRQGETVQRLPVLPLDTLEGSVQLNGVAVRLNPADLGEQTLILHAQPGVGDERYPQLHEMAASVWPLSDLLQGAVSQLIEAQAARGSDLALFDSTQVSDEAVEAELNSRMDAPPRVLMLRPDQVPGLNRRLLNYFAQGEGLPPVIVFVFSDRVQDDAGNTYALAFWA